MFSKFSNFSTKFIPKKEFLKLKMFINTISAYYTFEQYNVNKYSTFISFKTIFCSFFVTEMKKRGFGYCPLIVNRFFI